MGIILVKFTSLIIFVNSTVIVLLLYLIYDSTQCPQSFHKYHNFDRNILCSFCLWLNGNSTKLEYGFLFRFFLLVISTVAYSELFFSRSSVPFLCFFSFSSFLFLDVTPTFLLYRQSSQPKSEYVCQEKKISHCACTHAIQHFETKKQKRKKRKMKKRIRKCIATTTIAIDIVSLRLYYLHIKPPTHQKIPGLLL